MDEILASLELNAGLIDRSVVNLKKMGMANITVDLIEHRLEIIKGYWAELRSLHVKLVTMTSRKQKEELQYFTQNQFALAEEYYEKAVAGFLALKREKGGVASTSNAPNRNDTANNSLPRPFHLPRLDLPKFSGTYVGWNSFKDQFNSIFDLYPEASKVQKLQFLRSCLSGEALKLIETMPVTDVNYDSAWKSLTDRYENKRLLVDAYLESFVNLPKLKSRNVKDLRFLMDQANNAIIALTNLKICDPKWDPIVVFIIISKLDSQTRMEWEFELKNSTELPSFEQLKAFLTATIRALESSNAQCSSSMSQISKPHKSNKANFGSFQTNIAMQRCFVCRGNHKIYQCEKFKSKSVPLRLEYVKNNKRCINCLGHGHFISKCTSSSVCSICKQRHHSLLHKEIREEVCNPQPVSIGQGPNRMSDGPSTATDVSSCSALFAPSEDGICTGTVLLPTAVVMVKAPNGRWAKVKALLDQGSQSSFISENIARSLRLNFHKIQANVSVVGGEHSRTVKASTSFSIGPVHGGGPCVEVNALVLPKLTSYIPALVTIESSYTHLVGLMLADPVPQSADSIDVIIGSDVVGQVLLEEIRKGATDAPVAQRTIFGWVVFGNYERQIPRSSHSISVNHICTCKELEQSLHKFWQLEEFPENSHLSDEENQCEKHFLETYSRNSEGRYVVRLPFKSDVPIELPDSYNIAEKIFISTELRLHRNPERFAMYQDFLSEYVSLGHMREVNDLDSSSFVNYFSHHPVWRESSSTTKLRVVFNASMKTASQKSLNDFLLVGPKLQADLAALICRWRGFKIVFCADIEKMFRQIFVDERDIDYQRICWRSDSHSPVQSYQLLTVTYGTSCAPYLANRVLKQLAVDERERFPLASQILREQVYVDDVMAGADDIESAQNLQTELSELLMAGGFHLRKWASNSTELLRNIDHRDHGLACDKLLQEDETIKILGISWSPSSDSFRVLVNLPSVTSFTKRSFLSLMLRNFDPLGWVVAVTIRARIILQIIWTKKIGWDAALPRELNNRCLNYVESLRSLERISIPRWLKLSVSDNQPVIHGFSDASSSAYAAVVYIAVPKNIEESTISLVTAKAKVAPLKVVSIPRLELCAAHLLAKLVCSVQTSMQLPDCPVWCWSDSSVALTWLSSPPSRWKTFVANRVSDVLIKIPSASWRYVPGTENPADIASRGIDADKLAECKLWWSGPQWLSRTPEYWPENIVGSSREAFSEQKREETVMLITSLEIWSPFRAVSSWSRLLRITSYCNRFLNRARSKSGSDLSVTLSAAEIIEAGFFWVRRLQSSYFANELECLGQGRPIPSRSSLVKLNPILDDRGTIRVGGRLSNACLEYSQTHPVILPNCDVTALIVWKVHLETLHGGVRLTLFTLRQRFWLLRARVVVKRCISQCVVCARQRALPASQLMGDLPGFRVNPSRPFTHVGVDYAGPFLIRYAQGRGLKRCKVYVALFICLVTRAIHIELADSCSTADFIAAFERFVSRRGLPSHVYSDNGTNFVGAEKELGIYYKSIVQDPVLKAYCANERVSWQLIPPGAPHFGGVWEAGVKSLKFHLRRILGPLTPTREEFVTFLCKAEACLNSRPIGPLHDDAESLEALTPGHFLTGTSLKSIPVPSVLNVRENRLSRWQMVQRVTEQFWKMWSRDYLNTLQQRSRWALERKNVQVNDLVIVVNPQLPPAKWDLARVIECHPGADNLVRVVTIRTASGTYKRPVTKLCLLPISHE